MRSARVREKLELVGKGRRSQGGRRGRGDVEGDGEPEAGLAWEGFAMLAGFEAGMPSFKVLPEARELVGAKISKDLTIHVDDRSELLTGQFHHFMVGGFIGHDIHGLVIDVMIVEPAHGFMAPAAVRFDEQPHPSRFHIGTVAEVSRNFNEESGAAGCD